MKAPDKIKIVRFSDTKELEVGSLFNLVIPEWTCGNEED